MRTRRQEIGLSQEGLAKLEGGTIEDLSFSRAATLLDMLGLGLMIGPAHPRMRPRQADPTPALELELELELELAARTASVARGEVWANMRDMSRRLKSTRDLWNVDTS